MALLCVSIEHRLDIDLKRAVHFFWFTFIWNTLNRLTQLIRVDPTNEGIPEKFLNQNEVRVVMQFERSDHRTSESKAFKLKLNLTDLGPIV